MKPATEGRKGSGGGVKSAERTLDLLELLAGSTDRPLSLIEITKRLDIPKSSVHGLLKTLEARGYVRAEDGGYGLGYKIFATGMSYINGVSLVDRASGIVADLNRRTGETVHLASLDGTEVFYLLIKESPHPFRMVSQVGIRLPAHLTAVGKALLAQLSTEEMLRRYEGKSLAVLTDNSIRNLSELLDELAVTRDRGYAVDNEESNLGVQCVACAIRDAQGLPVAAISVTAPTVRMDRNRYARLVAQSARTISQSLGYQPDDERDLAES
jgi:IclR family KDG regulon transcriptional repressor